MFLLIEIFFPSFASKQQKKIISSQATLSLHYLYVLTMDHGKLQAFPSP